MSERSALSRAMAMVADLRARCPWDRVQTRETLRPYLVEEVHELDHALGEGDPPAIREEVSDLLLHLAWQLVLAEELREFTADDVADDLERKMKRRHPHLFDLGPRAAWETLKRQENGRGVLEGLPPLPPLLMAFRLQERAASVGFDWPDAAGPAAKVREELDELALEAGRRAGGQAGGPPDPRIEEEVGDLLFSVVNLARKLGVAPDNALQKANRKFADRFGAVERLAAERGIDVHRAGLDLLDRLWNEAKSI
ncbi:MAG TPA: nucleoside triphosphate pyrophosphohydrolase [Gemmatimonadales bacterium]|nr:nucleoside triphosphate pyrophosphohydrolase [Gemmatimonadales bacterium]